MNAAWWWVDRWRKSTAYYDMTAAEQGVYRNLLDELWLRDGEIPKDERVLAQIGGDFRAWKKVRAAVLSRFYETETGYRHHTHDEICLESKKRAERQRRYRERKRNKTDNVTGDVCPSPSPSPSPSPLTDERIPPPSEARAKRSRMSVSAPTYPEAFAAFWTAYPNKKAKSRALKAWKRQKAHEHLETILAAVEAQKASRQWTDEGGKFVPYPEKWINGRQWEDEVLQHTERDWKAIADRVLEREAS
jgi:uncharacterized protein YdaU (DUF1376 family)